MSDFFFERNHANRPMKRITVVPMMLVKGVEYVSPSTGLLPIVHEKMLIARNSKPKIAKTRYLPNLIKRFKNLPIVESFVIVSLAVYRSIGHSIILVWCGFGTTPLRLNGDREERRDVGR